MKTIFQKLTNAFLILILTAAAFSVSRCGSSGGTVLQEKTDPVISSDETWENCEVVIDGMLTIESGAVLTLKNVTLKFNAEVEDSTAVTINGSSLVADNCTFTSCSDKQWNLEAYGNSTMTLLADLAQAYDTAVLKLNGVTLAEDGSFPSITAEDDSTVEITYVDSISSARIYSVGNGKVKITGGTGWSTSMFEEENYGNINIE